MIDTQLYDRLCNDRANFIRGTKIDWALLRDGTITEGSSGTGTQRHFALASVTKILTGTLLAIALRKELTSLETSVGAILGNRCAMHDLVAGISLLQLATHSSGLPRLPTNIDKDSCDPYAAYSVDALYDFLQQVQPGLIADGRGVFEYSNLGAGLLGHLLGLVFKDGYETAIEREILRPLNMSSTYILSHNTDDERFVPLGFDGDSNPVVPWRFDALAGAGGIVSTAGDIATFIHCILEGSSEVAAAAQFALNPSRSAPLFWMRSPDNIFWHNGETYGAHAMVAVDVARRRAAIALWNAAYNLDDIPLFALGALDAPHALPVEALVNPDILDRYTGDYDGYLGRFTITLSDAQLHMSGPRYPSRRLYPISEGHFFTKRSPSYLTFEQDHRTGNVLAIEEPENWPPRRARRMLV